MGDSIEIDEARLTEFARSRLGSGWSLDGCPNKPAQARRPVFLVPSKKQPLFVKIATGPEAYLKAQAESRALIRLSEVDGLRAPRVVGISRTDDDCYLVLEHIEALPSQALTEKHWSQAGEHIARLHTQTWSKFGLEYDNYIGDFPQSNTPDVRWNRFYVNNRLIPMYLRAASGPYLSPTVRRQLDQVIDHIDALLERDVIPALLHGDLWPGNLMFDKEGPILIDPAISFGHSQMDIAFAQFDSSLEFPRPFYHSYLSAADIKPEPEHQTALWQLWPLLTHIVQDGEKWLSHLRERLDIICRTLPKSA